MSVGAFMGIRAAYTEQSQNYAQAYLEAISRALRHAALPEYQDPVNLPNVYVLGRFGRSALDNHSAGSLMYVAQIGVTRHGAVQLQLIASNPYRVSFVPIDFAVPLSTDYTEVIGGSQVPIWVGSAQALRRELRAMASAFSIPLDNGELSDEVAQRINDYEPLDEDDDGSMAEDERPAWLLLYEGARLSVEHGVALSLAG